MSRKFRPESRFETYADYVSWYRITFDGENCMMTRSAWEATR